MGGCPQSLSHPRVRLGPHHRWWMCFEPLALGTGQKHHVMGQWALGLTEGTEWPGSGQGSTWCLQLTRPQAEPRQDWLGFCPRSFSTSVPSGSCPNLARGALAFPPAFLFLSK